MERDSVDPGEAVELHGDENEGNDGKEKEADNGDNREAFEETNDG